MSQCSGGLARSEASARGSSSGHTGSTLPQQGIAVPFSRYGNRLSRGSLADFLSAFYVPRGNAGSGGLALARREVPRAADLQQLRDFGRLVAGRKQLAGGVKHVGRHDRLVSPAIAALRARHRQADDGPLLYQLALHFRDRGEDMEQQSLGR